MGSYRLSEDAALAVLLHASKHPSCTVNGVLLGKSAPDGGGHLITAAVPLFHRSHVMAPCMEAALTHTEIAAQRMGLLLLGYYHGDYHYGPAELGPLAKRVADRMSDRQPATCVLLLDNPGLAAFSGTAAAAAGGQADGGSGGGAGGGGLPLLLLLREGKTGPWRKVAPAGQQQQEGAAAGGGGGGLSIDGGGGWDAVRKRYLNLFAAGRHRALADFEEHLDDVGRDFLNEGLLAGSELLAR